MTIDDTNQRQDAVRIEQPTATSGRNSPDEIPDHSRVSTDDVVISATDAPQKDGSPKAQAPPDLVESGQTETGYETEPSDLLIVDELIVSAWTADDGIDSQSPGQESDQSTIVEPSPTESIDSPVVTDEPVDTTTDPEGTSHDEIRDLMATHREELDHEIDEFRKSKARLEECVRFSSELRSIIEQKKNQAIEIVNLCNILDNAELPETMVDKVSNSKAGIDLVLKMISRLPERLPRIDHSQIASEDSFVKPGDEIVPAEPFEIKRYFDDISSKNYGLVTSTRRAAEDATSALFNFLKTHFLAIVDGVNDGKRHFEEQRVELLNTHADYQREIDLWFGVYNDLLELFDDVFAKFELEPIKPQAGEKADYNLHEPFDTVKTDQFADESVYELIRPGYRYSGVLYGDSGYIVRPALIVVSKNG